MRPVSCPRFNRWGLFCSTHLDFRNFLEANRLWPTSINIAWVHRSFARAGWRGLGTPLCDESRISIGMSNCPK